MRPKETIKPIKGFSCVELQDQEAIKIHEITRHMTRNEEAEYWNKRTAEFRKDVEMRKTKKRLVLS
jgi:hypothetical protein